MTNGQCQRAAALHVNFNPIFICVRSALLYYYLCYYYLRCSNGKMCNSFAQHVFSSLYYLAQSGIWRRCQIIRG